MLVRYHLTPLPWGATDENNDVKDKGREFQFENIGLVTVLTDLNVI